MPQRNFYSPESVGSPAKWTSVAGCQNQLVYEPVVPGRNARPTINIVGATQSPRQLGATQTAAAGAVIASFDLANNPDLAGQSVYFAFEASVSAPGESLSMMIDPGDGHWQFSNSSKGLDCPLLLGFGCEGPTSNATVGGFHMRSYQATLSAAGVARFALRLSGGNATLSGVTIARIGAMWHSL